jgi:uncharacterized protein involved in exopolysaccharide biosynthesis
MESVVRSVDVEDEIDLTKIAKVLWHYKWLIAATTLVAALIAVVVALTAPVVYRAQAVVSKVEVDGMNAAASLANQFGGLANLAGINLGAGSASHEAQAVLHSRRLAVEFIERNKLLSELSHGGSKPLTLWKAVNKFKQNVVSIREDKRTGLTTIIVNWHDPAIAAKWANELVVLANELIRARALADSTRNIDYLNEQIANTKVVELQNVMYNLIENETKTLMIANARAEYAFTLIDPAVTPEIRESPKRTLIVLFGVALGFIFGLIAVFICNVFASRKKNEVPLSTLSSGQH